MVERVPVLSPEERKISIVRGVVKGSRSEAGRSKPEQVEVEASGIISTDFSTGGVPSLSEIFRRQEPEERY